MSDVEFNPGGFFLKLLFSLGFIILAGPDFKANGVIEFISCILAFLMIFVVFYAIASLFGFAVNVTRNYLIGFILFVILIAVFFALYGKLEEVLAGWGGTGEILLNIALIVVLVWPFINDIRKAILYIKN